MKTKKSTKNLTTSQKSKLFTTSYKGIIQDVNALQKEVNAKLKDIRNRSQKLYVLGNTLYDKDRNYAPAFAKLPDMMEMLDCLRDHYVDVKIS